MVLETVKELFGKKKNNPMQKNSPILCFSKDGTSFLMEESDFRAKEKIMNVEGFYLWLIPACLVDLVNTCMETFTMDLDVSLL